MLRRLRKELIFLGPGVIVVLAISLAAYVLPQAISGSSSPPSSPPSISRPEDPGPQVWVRTGSHIAEQQGVALTVHTYRVRWDAIRIVYSVSHSLGLNASPEGIAIIDDTGASYAILSHALLGNALGVTAGVLIAEPYKGQGRTLTLTVNGMKVEGTTEPPQTIAGVWSVPFLENRAAGAPVDYTEGGRIAEEVISVGDSTIGIAGPPGGSFIKMMIDTSGNQSALYGVISDEVARPVSEAEFRQLLADQTTFTDFPPPPEFPQPAG